ncbi:MAG: glucokinase [Ancalomicrobiaceae bacterium]|nr:glucokinase [Ancalomicrobiaceae bacterium]
MSQPRPFPTFPFPVLVGDIGGTNARFALLEGPDAELKIFPFAATVDYFGPAEAIEAVVMATGARPKTLIVALAGPITGDSARLTNCPWVFEPKKLIERLGLADVVLLNDFEAQALALPSLQAGDMKQLGRGEIRPEAPKVVLGPGTGLGVGILAFAAGMWIPLPGEGGHVTLGPLTERDVAVWKYLTRIDGRVTAESVLSGPGMLNLYTAIARADGVEPVCHSPQEVTAAAKAGDRQAQETEAMFARHLGAVAGDFALTALARGGVFLAGGVSQKIEAALSDGSFRAAFEDKAPHRHLSESIPTFLITHSGPALLGLSDYARKPASYGVDLAGRRWTA